MLYYVNDINLLINEVEKPHQIFFVKLDMYVCVTREAKGAKQRPRVVNKRPMRLKRAIFNIARMGHQKKKYIIIFSLKIPERVKPVGILLYNVLEISTKYVTGKGVFLIFFPIYKNIYIDNCLRVRLHYPVDIFHEVESIKILRKSSH